VPAVPRGLRRSRHLLHDAVVVARAQYYSRRTRHEATARLSPQLRSFVEDLPEERSSLLAFVMGVASRLPAGTRVLDAGAGDAPYRELFDHCEYTTADWENSPHASAPTADIVGSLEALPVDDCSSATCRLGCRPPAQPSAQSSVKELSRILVNVELTILPLVRFE
jgi:hypothetical protein